MIWRRCSRVPEPPPVDRPCAATYFGTEVMAARSMIDEVRRVRLYHRLQVTAHVVHVASDRRMVAATGLTTAQVAVLAVVDEHGPSSQREIAAKLGVNEPAVTEMVGRLAAAG